MADVTLSKSTILFKTGNNYVVKKPLDYKGGTITAQGNAVISIREGGKISNAVIVSEGLAKIRIETSDVPFENVTFKGDFRQGNIPEFGTTKEIGSYNFPLNFRIRTLGFYEESDGHGTEFVVKNKEAVNYAALWGKDTSNIEMSEIPRTDNAWYFTFREKYLAEHLGVIANSKENKDANARILESFGGYHRTIKLKPAQYYISDVNTDLAGGGIILEGESNPSTQIERRTQISTERSNFMYCVKMGGQPVLKNLFITTSFGQIFSEPMRSWERRGYGFTRFTDGNINGKPNESGQGTDVSGVYENVQFVGFKAGHYAPTYSTNCRLKNVTFLNCEAGFWGTDASNRSTFEEIMLHQCDVGIFAWGLNTRILQVEITPEQYFRAPGWDKVKQRYGIITGGATEVRQVYMEGYLGDGVTPGTFTALKVDGSFSSETCVNVYDTFFMEMSSVNAINALEVVQNDAVHPIVKFHNSDFPVKVYNPSGNLVRGIIYNDKPYFEKTQKRIDEEGVYSLIATDGIMCNYAGEAKFMSDKFAVEPHVYLHLDLADYVNRAGLVGDPGKVFDGVITRKRFNDAQWLNTVKLRDSNRWFNLSFRLRLKLKDHGTFRFAYGRESNLKYRDVNTYQDAAGIWLDINITDRMFEGEAYAYVPMIFAFLYDRDFTHFDPKGVEWSDYKLQMISEPFLQDETYSR